MFKDRETLLYAFNEQRAALTRFLARRLGCEALAEDLAQETWLRLAGRGTAGIGNFRAYLFRIASNLAFDHQRHAGLGIEVEADAALVDRVADPTPTPETVALQRSEWERLLRAVDALPPRCREVFLLAKFEDLSYSEIAARLGIAKNTVMVHMVKALGCLERAMRDDEPRP